MEERMHSTNELQVLVIGVAGAEFGMNITKIQELARYQEVQRISYSNPCIEGTVNLRGEVFTVVDLAKYLDLPASNDPEHDILIIMKFKQEGMAFHVHQADSVSRFSWETIESADSSLCVDKENIVVGAAMLNDRVITLIDFDWIMHEIAAVLEVEAQTSQDAEISRSNSAESHLKPFISHGKYSFTDNISPCP